MEPMKGKDRIILALDAPTRKEAEKLFSELCNYVGAFKIGLQLLSTADGQGIVDTITQTGFKVFYDGKFNDIPNTIAGAAKSVASRGVWAFNVHANAGAEAMKAAVRERGRSLVLAVTVLTSLSHADLVELGIEKDHGIADEKERKTFEPARVLYHVLERAKLARECGLDGVIASPLEAGFIRDRVPAEFLIVTPGIRPTWAAAGDQKRITTPADAIRSGADYLVIGRPITNPPENVDAFFPDQPNLTRRQRAALHIAEEIVKGMVTS